MEAPGLHPGCGCFPGWCQNIMTDKAYARNDTQVKKLKFTHIVRKKILCLYNPNTLTESQKDFLEDRVCV